MAQGAKAPEVVERFLKALIVANKAVGLYPVSSAIPRQSADAAVTALEEVLRERPELVLGVKKDGMTFDDAVVLAARSSSTNFALDLYNRRVAEVRFHAGTSSADVLGFLSVLTHSPAQVDGAGGFECRLWELGITAITVVEVRVTVVDAGELLSAADTAPLTRADIDRAIGIDGAVNRRDTIIVARFFSDPGAIADYLSGLYGPTGSSQEVAARFALLASAAATVQDTDFFAPRNLAEALTQMEAIFRSDLLLEEVLPEARSSEAVSDVLRQLDMEELLRMICAGVDPADPPLDALARGVRQAMTLYAVSPGDLEVAAGAAMREIGMQESDIALVLERARPQVLTYKEAARVVAGSAQSPDSSVSTVEHSFKALSEEELQELPELLELRAEAARGVTNGDVALALITTLAEETDDKRFATTMTALESTLRMVVERGEIAAAADVAEALDVAMADPRFSDEQKARMERAVVTLARPSDVKAIVRRMRHSPLGSPERAAAERLLDLLGPRAVDPLLEQLANEPDMSARKGLIDILGRVAPRHIPEVGAHVADSRWFVVRNVVAILGATRASATIPYLERTMRHGDARVRRETIRALSGINDRFAHQMLVSALTDEDPQNVQLAARYLGQARVDLAVPALERVARGEGFGSRELGPRVEAIEALGRMGATQAMPTLEVLASKRTLLQANKTRELRAAAETAVARIRATGGAR